MDPTLGYPTPSTITTRFPMLMVERKRNMSSKKSKRYEYLRKGRSHARQALAHPILLTASTANFSSASADGVSPFKYARVKPL
jgi:hypothetical protein